MVKNMTLSKDMMNAFVAEKFCVNQGGHLASVGSREENDELKKLAGDEVVWLGGRRGEGDKWQWLEGRPWTYQNWLLDDGLLDDEPNLQPGYDCMIMDQMGYWYSRLCNDQNYFLCNHPIRMTGNRTLAFKSPYLVNQSFFLHNW